MNNKPRKRPVIRTVLENECDCCCAIGYVYRLNEDRNRVWYCWYCYASDQIVDKLIRADVQFYDKDGKNLEDYEQ